MHGLDHLQVIIKNDLKEYKKQDYKHYLIIFKNEIVDVFSGGMIYYFNRCSFH
tara:strand:+ start:267 stop:425 length:159 start_codon:yes stop_codon:yes gene_type:complete